MSFSRPLASALSGVALLPLTLSAQLAPSAPATASTAPAHSHAHAQANPHGTVTLDQFVTSATPFARNQVDLAQSTTVLSGPALLLKQQPSLGETLGAEAGISATSFGPGASRPIIRGLGGDRIRLLENSVGTIDASVTSPDHAVSVEPFLIERIEVVRGPASLLYGSNAVGGVVNVITHRIETDLPTEAMRGTVELRGSTGADEFTRGGLLDFALLRGDEKALVLHLDGFRRDTKDVRIPGFVESARLRAEETEHAEEHGEPAPEFARGRLQNSALDTQGGAVGLSFVSPAVHLGASYSGLDSNYGVPGHVHEGEEGGVRIELEQRRTDVQGEWHAHGSSPIHGARFKFGHARYRHVEREPDGAVGTIFANRGHDARLELLHGDGKPWSGAVGVQSARSNFSAEGDEAFLPPSVTRNDALFAFQDVTQGALSWQFGGRIERSRLTPAGGTTRRDTELASSLGLVRKLGAEHALAVSITHTGRAPNAQELFAYGPHAGTQSFEIGSATLEAERSLGFEASLRRTRGRITGALTLHANRFDGYIFEQPTGFAAVIHGGEWEFLPVDDPHLVEHHHDDALPVYRTLQRDARFWGAELETIFHLHDQRNAQLDLKLTADFTRARAAGEDLPRIPAARITTGLVWAHDEWSASVESQFVFEQERVAANETTSEGYTLLNAHVSRVIVLGRTRWDIFLRGNNLANEEARPHTSFVKELAPLPGRSATLGMRLAF